MNFFTSIKDSVISFTGEKILSAQIKRYGEMLDLNIDSQNKRISIKLSLKGEAEPLLITINDYEFLEIDGSEFIIIKNIDTSKEWINLIIEDFIKEKRIKLPSKYAGIIKMLM